ncbi:TPA: hypothetical protein OL795_000546 [Klebsiella pneumoniae]|nr:hypothetical protein [Klebsiella pneumoniae subsp. pneumoniae]HBR4443305.1 hypothetical protein [Klebsiella pneumoniae]HCQ7567823.1 hypothetical protein [Klebsiella pneumoniae]
MTKSTITREQLLEIIETDHVQCGEASYLARMALAAMDSEPDCKERKLFCSTDTARMRKVISVSAGTGDAPLYRHAQPVADSEQDRNPVLGYADSYRDMAKQSVESVPIWSVITDLERNIAPLYRHAQPAPVVPEEVTDEDCPALVKYDVTEVDEAWARGFNACRSAMLQELKKSAGTEATCRSNENAQVLTSINPAPDLVSLPKNAKSLTGNSPVIPDGYVMVPKEPTESMVIAGFESEPDEFFSESEVWEAYQKMSGCEQAAFRARLCWTAMLAAAPQEVKGE